MGHRTSIHLAFWPKETDGISFDFLKSIIAPVFTTFSDLDPEKVLRDTGKYGFGKNGEFKIPEPFPFIHKGQVTATINEEGKLTYAFQRLHINTKPIMETQNESV